MKLEIAPPWPTIGLCRRVHLAFGAVVPLTVVSGAAGVAAVGKTDATVETFIHRHEPLLAHNNAIVQGLTDAESGQRDLLLTGQQPALDRYHSGTARFPEEFASARALVASDPKLARSGS